MGFHPTNNEMCFFYLKTSMIYTTHDLESVSQYVLSLSVRTLTKTKELLILIRLTEFRQQSFLRTLPIHSQENCVQMEETQENCFSPQEQITQ